MLTTIPELVAQIKQSINFTSASDARKVIDQGDAVLIDVREPDEFAQRSAAGAINIPRGLIEMKMLQLYPDAQQAIFVHCATGARACFATEQLQRLGYSNVVAITCPLDGVCDACQP
ncbi:rhodanese-like domain-containing protein [Colwellia sp. D2M02]|uniref:Rhodanese domain-containing protein n=2 Tax=Colwelliaceae TaxID=267889 RepID=A0ABN1LBB1_9GAMM|nr:rhodanese-like domain-containing protein [Colwellia sp. D2M02]